MLGSMQILDIINLYKQGSSRREIARALKINRRTVTDYCDEYDQAQKEIKTETDPRKIAELQSVLTGQRRRKSNSKRTACTPEVYARIEEILKEEKEKEKLLGWKKQGLTAKQILEILREEGFVIGYTSVKQIVRELKNKHPECYIMQEHPLGKRLEYDFGEVHLLIGRNDSSAKKKSYKKYYIAVFAAPASDFRWAYLYEKSDLDVFIDSHVQFFRMIGGVWEEVVYDNMKNVVSCFKNGEKIINLEARKLAAYYSYAINTTNVRRGNEKGSVERSVAYTRNQIFAKKFRFDSLEDARQYMAEQLVKLNKGSSIEKEKLSLRPANIPYLTCREEIRHVDKEAFIQIQKHKYSVPEDFVGQDLTVRLYADRIDIFRKNDFICSHKKGTGYGVTADIRHYIRTLTEKPGAICDSVALRSFPELKVVYDMYYTKYPELFISLVDKHKDLSNEDMAKALSRDAVDLLAKPVPSKDNKGGKSHQELSDNAQAVVSLYNNLTIKGN